MIKMLSAGIITRLDKQIGYSPGTMIDTPVEGDLSIGEFVRVTEAGIITKWDNKGSPVGRVMRTRGTGQATIVLTDTLYEFITDEDAEENRIIKKGW